MTRPDSPDPDSSEYGVMEQSEALDEDEMAVDPLEGGMDPPEGWSGADRYGTTANEQGDERPLEERLGEERPDVDEPSSDEVPAESGSGRDVVVGDELDRTGESQTRRAGHTNPEPDTPAADETVRPREE